jgi:hypothetical protein
MIYKEKNIKLMKHLLEYESYENQVNEGAIPVYNEDEFIKNAVKRSAHNNKRFTWKVLKSKRSSTAKPYITI